MKMLPVAVAIVLLSGCAYGPPSETLISSNADVSASYRSGFDDGCHSGRQAAGSLFDQFRKDQDRFNFDVDYAQGWSDAFRQCETREEALNRQIRSARTIDAINRSKDKRFDDVLRGVDTSALKDLYPD